MRIATDPRVRLGSLIVILTGIVPAAIRYLPNS
jgi:hypothetical protein